MRSIYYAKSNQEDEIPSIVIKGSFFTKIKFITIKLMELIAQDPKVKVLVFSSVSIVNFINVLMYFHSISGIIMREGDDGGWIPLRFFFCVKCVLSKYNLPLSIDESTQ